MADVPEMDAPVTRREMHDALGTWAGAIIEKLSTVIAERLGELRTELRSELRATETRFSGELRAGEMRLSDELRQHTRSSESELATRLVAVDQQYQDLPSRVSRLEAKVFAPPKRRRRAQRTR
jgi:hypothetical protein